MALQVDWSKYNNKTPEFSLKDITMEGKCVDVYDGDTIKLVLNVPINDKLYRWNCRIARVDTPELRTRNLKEKEFGYEVRNKLREKILNKIVKVTCGEFDKYGRLLVEIMIEEDGKLNNISDWLIENQYAFTYNGGTKKLWFPEN